VPICDLPLSCPHESCVSASVLYAPIATSGTTTSSSIRSRTTWHNGHCYVFAGRGETSPAAARSQSPASGTRRRSGSANRAACPCPAGRLTTSSPRAPRSTPAAFTAATPADYSPPDRDCDPCPKTGSSAPGNLSSPSSAAGSGLKKPIRRDQPPAEPNRPAPVSLIKAMRTPESIG
jgi:hypothetical protein